MEINASTFKAECLQLLERVRRYGTEIVVTKRGEPIARVVPFTPVTGESGVLGALRGTGRSVGDIVAPTEEEFDLDS